MCNSDDDCLLIAMIDEDGENAFPPQKMQIIRAAMNVKRIMMAGINIGMSMSNCVIAVSDYYE